MKLLVPIGFSSFREIVRQPFYYIILFSGCFIILLSFAFTFFAFGEEVRMIRDMAISTITFGGLLTGCLASSISIAGEFERQTVSAVLCKPVSRADFIIGKYLGIVAAIFLLVFSQGFVLEVALIIRNFSSIQNNATNISSLIDFVCILGICFCLLQILIITAISLVFSLYLNTIANLTICLLFFILCNSYSYFVPFSFNGNSFISVCVSIYYVFLPDFQNLSMPAINEIITSPAPKWQDGIFMQYIVYNIFAYTIYCAIVVSMAVFLFKRKEIA